MKLFLIDYSAIEKKKIFKTFRAEESFFVQKVKFYNS